MTEALTKKTLMTKTTPYDVAQHPRTPEEMAAYLDAYSHDFPNHPYPSGCTCQTCRG